MKEPFRLPTIRAAVEFRRESYGWTQSRMAKALGMEKSHYSEFVSGLLTLPKGAMCKAFEIGVPPDVLLQTPATKRAYERRQRELLDTEVRRQSRPRRGKG